MAENNPFDFALPGSIASAFGKQTFQEFTTERDTKRSRIAGEFRTRVLQLIEGGTDPKAAALQILSSPFGADFVTDPNFAQTVEEMSSLFTPAGPEAVKVGAGETLLNRDAATGESSVAFQAPTAPSATEKLVGAILEAKEAGDTERANLLTRGLPVQPNGRMDVGDFLAVTASGVDVPRANRPQGLESVSPQQAEDAVRLGQSDKGRAPNLVDLVLRGLGQATGTDLDTVDPTVAQGAAVIRSRLAKDQSGGSIVEQLIQSQGGGVAGAGEGDESVEALFQRFNEQRQQGVERPAEGTGPTLEGRRPEAGAAPALGAPQPFTGDIGALDEAGIRSLAEQELAGTVALSTEQAQALVQRLRALGQ